MKRHRFEVSIRIWHPSINPEEISNNLGVVPRVARMAGADRSTPSGRPLAGANRETFWSYRCPAVAEGGLAGAVGYCLEVIDVAEPFVRALIASGGRIELFVGWFCSGNCGDVLDSPSLGRLGRLGVNLSFDVYAPDSQSNLAPKGGPS